MGVKNIFRESIRDFLSLIYPKTCPGCSQSMVRGENGLCTICKHELSVTNYHLDQTNALSSKFYGRLPLENAFAYIFFHKGGVAQSILHELKYNGNVEIGKLMGQWYGHELSKLHLSIDLIVPVPLHKIKLKKRGYNQSDYFAWGLSDALEVPWNKDILIRHIQSETQTNKTKEERWKNVKDNFVVKNDANIVDKHLLLVDDVITTGATIEACGNALLNSGISKLSVGSLAMAK